MNRGEGCAKTARTLKKQNKKKLTALKAQSIQGLCPWSLLSSSLRWPESDYGSKQAVGFSSLCIIFRCLDQYLLMWLFRPHDTPQPKICKRFRSPGIDSNESHPPDYVVWRAGTTCRVGGFNFIFFFGISIGITRRMIDISKKITFYFLQNVWKCTVFFAFAF